MFAKKEPIFITGSGKSYIVFNRQTFSVTIPDTMGIGPRDPSPNRKPSLGRLRFVIYDLQGSSFL
ncbi:hypothetical protein [Paenibacillus odorifer]|uniref:hypothetical protein n=1 Tax=Paenibacillus odorifer TaxID=189426 RepID=UPI0011307D90|nr:hypothetical protein [Paenibacillus odorifer]